MELYKCYRPITATPFRRNETYMEFEPCDALKPYIRCFWGTQRVIQNTGSVGRAEIVTPDSCMDITFTVDFTNNRIESRFVAIDDRAFLTESAGKGKKAYLLFGIRFYPWGVAAFAEDSLRGTKNAFFDAGQHFPGIKKEMEKRLFYTSNIYELIPIAEEILLGCRSRQQNQAVHQAICKIVENKGNISMADVSREMSVGGRQLERMFGEYVGIAPKALASIVRYQCLWREILCHGNFNILDAVCRYGYADQAHLCRDFKKYHSLSIAEARKYSRCQV